MHNLEVQIDLVYTVFTKLQTGEKPGLDFQILQEILAMHKHGIASKYLRHLLILILLLACVLILSILKMAVRRG